MVPAGLPEPLLEELDVLSYREQLDAISTGCQSAVACRNDVPNLFSPTSLTGQPPCCASPDGNTHLQLPARLALQSICQAAQSTAACLLYTWHQNLLCSPC